MMGETGLTYTEDHVEEPEQLDVANEPTEPTAEEAKGGEVDNKGSDDEPKTDYDIAKERYDDIKGKYSFRNVFVTAEKLKMDIAAYKEGKPGANGKPVGGGTIFMDIFEMTRGNIIESIVEVAMCGFLDKHFPEKDVEVDDPSAHVDPAQSKSGFYVSVDAPDTFKDVALHFYDNGFVDKDASASPVKSESNVDILTSCTMSRPPWI